MNKSENGIAGWTIPFVSNDTLCTAECVIELASTSTVVCIAGSVAAGKKQKNDDDIAAAAVVTTEETAVIATSATAEQ